MVLPLEGMRVIDLSRMLPGPYCTSLLADMGAEVIRIEDPVTGDVMRMAPPYDSNQESVPFGILNRNKQSITIDLKKKEGRELLVELAGWAEVLVEQFRPGVMEKLGLDYEVIKEVNPSIIYCSITGYGQEGPYSARASHDINILGYSGILGSLAAKGEKPVIYPVQLADVSSGILAAYSILAAYIERKKDGRGQHLDVSMMDSMISWMTMNAGELLGLGNGPMVSLDILDGKAPFYRAYETSNGYIAVGAVENKFWSRLCELLGRPEYGGKQYSFEDYDEINGWLEETFRKKSRDEWMEFFKDEDLCVSPVLTFEEAGRDPHVVHRDIITGVETGLPGIGKTVGFPVKFSETPWEIKSAAPGPGDHTNEILTMLGCDIAEIERLRSGGVIS